MITFTQDKLRANEAEETPEIPVYEDIRYSTSNLNFYTAHLLLSEFSNIERDLEVEDMSDALEAEAEYLAKGKDAFKRYDEYRANRLG
jgi:hypothetical protein